MSTKWMLKEITVPEASWELQRPFESATLKLESEYKVETYKKDRTRPRASLTTKVSFIVGDEDSEENIGGFIKVRSMAKFEGQLNTNSIEEGDPEDLEFFKMVSHLLLGSNRTHIAQISLMAGLGQAVTLPMTEFRAEDIVSDRTEEG